MFGGSLLVVLAAEKLILSRIARVRHWLGLHAPGLAGRRLKPNIVRAARPPAGDSVARFCHTGTVS